MQKPKVIAVCKNAANIKDKTIFVATYKNDDIVTAYNHILSKKMGEIVIFAGDFKIDKDSVDYCLSMFAGYTDMLSCIYGDLNVPLFSVEKMNINFNIPFIFNAKNFPQKLNEKDPLYSVNFLKHMSKTSLVYHLPRKIFYE